jgi:D-serine deaminase-like pyridoxal phosphate-dependent protein
LDLVTVPTPRVFIDLARVRRNISRMAALASAAGVRLRPHAKTHKSPLIARWQIDAGAVGICCAKPGEAEVFAAAGIADIRMPYPISPSNAGRAIAIMDRAQLSIVVDHFDVAREWAAAMSRAGRQLDVLVKVDVGFHRCGVDPELSSTAETIQAIASLRGLRFRGLLSHAGHGYLAGSEAELEDIAVREAHLLRSLAEELAQLGVHADEISVGATPTARFVAHQPGVTEMRPGNYVFFDRTQVGLGAATLDDCALGVVSTVVSRPARNRAILDAGSKTLSADGARGFETAPGYGLVFASLEATTPDRDIVIERLSEEHATARVTDDCPLEPGDRVRILPNHSCVVVNLVDELLVVDGPAIVDRLPVAARGRSF